MFGSSIVNESLGKGKDRPFDEHFDFLLELANHGVFRANQNFVYRRHFSRSLGAQTVPYLALVIFRNHGALDSLKQLSSPRRPYANMRAFPSSES